MYVILYRDPIGHCHLCGVPLYSERDTKAHLDSPNHRLAVADALAERHEEKRRLILFHEADDPEIEAHMRKVGARMLREGRWEVRPNEKAGF